MIVQRMQICGEEAVFDLLPVSRFHLKGTAWIRCNTIELVRDRTPGAGLELLVLVLGDPECGQSADPFRAWVVVGRCGHGDMHVHLRRSLICPAGSGAADRNSLMSIAEWYRKIRNAK